MESAKENLALVVEEDILLAARKVALDRGTSLEQLVQEYLADLSQVSSRRRLPRAKLNELMDKGLFDSADRTWIRDDLHER